MGLRKDAKLEVVEAGSRSFASCSKQELGRDRDPHRRVAFPGREALIREGERGHEFFALMDGKVT